MVLVSSLVAAALLAATGARALLPPGAGGLPRQPARREEPTMALPRRATKRRRVVIELGDRERNSGQKKKRTTEFVAQKHHVAGKINPLKQARQGVISAAKTGALGMGHWLPLRRSRNGKGWGMELGGVVMQDCG
jgi:hypothetical protein